MWKIKLSAPKQLKWWLWHLASLLWSKNIFLSGTGTSQKAEKMLMTTRKVGSNVKDLLTVFFDYNGVVHREFLPEGPTANKEYYLEVMRHLRKAIRKNTRIWGKTILGCSHIVANPWFFEQKQHSNRIHRTWPPAAFSCSQNSKNPWKGGDLPRSRRLRLHRWKSSRLYRKVLMRSASRIGKSVGTSVLCLEHNFILQTAIQDARRCGGHIAITWLHLSNAFGSIPYSTISSIGHLLGLDCRLRPFLSSRGSTTTAPPRLGVPRVWLTPSL